MVMRKDPRKLGFALLSRRGGGGCCRGSFVIVLKSD